MLIRGFLEHNEKCLTNPITRSPVWPVHPSVYEDALRRLKAGVSLDEIKRANQDLFMSRGYSAMPKDLSTSRYRWLLTNKDNRSLYRQYHRLRGVKLVQKDHINVHEWLDPDSPQFNQTLRDAIFHYAPRTEGQDRLEICISTPEMREAAWKYGHHSQILLDGTFGISDKKMLLFIVMGIDEANRGVPLAFLLFSAPGTNQKTAAGYDTAILEKLLESWRQDMGTRDGEDFEVWVAITDTDLIERGALLRVFPRILLLICKFHLRQSWKNHRGKSLRGATSQHDDFRERLRRLENLLIETEDFDSAKSLVSDEKTTVVNLRDADECDADVATGVLKHLDYLESYWLREALWQSWSKAGRLRAAVLMKRPVNEVVPTTNHLESFNGVLKRKHLRRWQNNGRRLRVDVLVHVLILYALPSVFRQHAIEDLERQRRETLLRTVPGGSAILNAKGKVSTPLAPIAYWADDSLRDAGAAALVTNKQISAPNFDAQTNTYTFTCYSSLATDHDGRLVTYNIAISQGETTCSCPDFQRRGGACKHIRAAVVRVEVLRAQSVQIPSLRPWIPDTAEEAYLRQSRRRTEAIISASSSGPTIDLDPVARAAQTVDQIVRAAEIEPGVILSGGNGKEAGGVETLVDDAASSNSDGMQLAYTDSDFTSEADSDFTSADQAELDDESSDSDSDRRAEKEEFAELTRTNLQALNDQTIARTLHDLEVVAPKLAQLGEWLSDAHLSKDAEADIRRAREVRPTLDAITRQLDRMLREVDGGSANDVASSLLNLRPHSPAPPQPTVRSTQRTSYSGILGPPVEKRAQKRKESYNVH